MFLSGDAATYTTGRSGLLRYAGSGTLRVQAGTTFEDGKTTGNGGAISMVSGQLAIEGGVFPRNRGSSGGAVYTGTSGASLSVTGGTFTGNVASSGGAIYHTATGTMISDATFTGNVASFFGGALVLPNGGATVADCVFTDNSVSGGGGGAIMTNQNGGALTVSGSTFHRNTARDWGGAIGFGTSLTLTNCDLGTGTDDNSPLDVSRLSSAPTFNGGTNATVSCNTTSCAAP